MQRINQHEYLTWKYQRNVPTSRSISRRCFQGHNLQSTNRQYGEREICLPPNEEDPRKDYALRQDRARTRKVDLYALQQAATGAICYPYRNHQTVYPTSKQANIYPKSSFCNRSQKASLQARPTSSRRCHRTRRTTNDPHRRRGDLLLSKQGNKVQECRRGLCPSKRKNCPRLCCEAFQVGIQGRSALLRTVVIGFMRGRLRGVRQRIGRV